MQIDIRKEVNLKSKEYWWLNGKYLTIVIITKINTFFKLYKIMFL